MADGQRSRSSGAWSKHPGAVGASPGERDVEEPELLDPLLQFLLALAIIIVAANGAGYLSTRLGQQAVLGELLIGLILGPTALNMLDWPLFSDPHLGQTLNHLSHPGVLFLMIAWKTFYDSSLRNRGSEVSSSPMSRGFCLA